MLQVLKSVVIHKMKLTISKISLFHFILGKANYARYIFDDIIYRFTSVDDAGPQTKSQRTSHEQNRSLLT